MTNADTVLRIVTQLYVVCRPDMSTYQTDNAYILHARTLTSTHTHTLTPELI